MTSNNIRGLFPTRFQVTDTQRVARIYARDEEGNMVEFTTKTFLSEGFILIMRRATLLANTLMEKGFDGLFTLGFHVTVKPMGPVNSTFVWEASALATERPIEFRMGARPRRFNHNKDLYAMKAV